MDRTSILFTQYCISVGLCCILLYMYGFFPIKKSTNIFSSEEDLPSVLNGLKFHKEKLYSGSVGKTILMVIDGLRVDFVTEHNMPYTSGVLAAREQGCQLTARVSAPTVTLPRIKAIVTGTVSNYIDVVLNFGTVELQSDNIIHQAVQTKTVVFYGDDTWIKLFPRHFTRSEGTSSFFVNDYTEVDSNVTRHLDFELQKSDWSLMVLHYLGLDHIGHIQGPRSPLVQPKLLEMDEVIARLHNHLNAKGGLLVVCGDHGMKDSGSHGGVSPPEVLVPAIFLGLSCSNHLKDEILQVDLAATMSVLWGGPIPADSMGVAAAGLLGHLSSAQRLYARLYNSQQLAANFLRNGGSTLHEGYLKYKEAQQRHYEWLINSSVITHQQVDEIYHDSLTHMSHFLSEVLGGYHMLALISATVVLFQVVCMLSLQLTATRPLGWPSAKSVLVLTMLLVVILTVNRLTSVYSLVCVVLTSFTTLTLYRHLKSISNVSMLEVLFQIKLSWRSLLSLGTLMFCVSLFSSSLIEEEHQVWYWLWTTIGVLRLRENPIMWLGVLAAQRVLRSINQTGDKWAHLPDVSDWLNLPHNRLLLSILCALSLVFVCLCSAKLLSSWLVMPLCICCTVFVYLHKAADHQVIAFTPFLSNGGIMEARICWLLVALLLILGRSLDSVIVCWMLSCSLLLRAYNTLLVPALFLFTKALAASPSPTLFNTVLHQWLGAVFFFCQGNSNSLASVDVATGYVGLDEYNAVIVGALLLMHTYAMPVLAYLLNMHSIISNSKDWRVELTRSAQVVTLLQLLHTAVCTVVITLQRYHLFVWSVFSPKLLYVAAQTIVYFILVTITNIWIYFSYLRLK